MMICTQRDRFAKTVCVCCALAADIWRARRGVAAHIPHWCEHTINGARPVMIMRARTEAINPWPHHTAGVVWN